MLRRVVGHSFEVSENIAVNSAADRRGAFVAGHPVKVLLSGLVFQQIHIVLIFHQGGVLSVVLVAVNPNRRVQHMA